MSPLRVYDLFKKITDEDAAVLWLNPRHGRPENLILHNLLVPPVPIRPSVAMEVGGGSNEDDLTTQLVEILQINHSVRMLLAGGGQQPSIMEQWGFEQAQVSRFINGELPGSQQSYGEKKIRGLCQRLKGKSGRFRGNLSGKRVDFSGRTVISPDPNLAIDQVGWGGDCCDAACWFHGSISPIIHSSVLKRTGGRAAARGQGDDVPGARLGLEPRAAAAAGDERPHRAPGRQHHPALGGQLLHQVPLLRRPEAAQEDGGR